MLQVSDTSLRSYPRTSVGEEMYKKSRKTKKIAKYQERLSAYVLERSNAQSLGKNSLIPDFPTDLYWHDSRG